MSQKVCMRGLTISFIALATMAALPGCAGSRNDQTADNTDINARLSAEDHCMAKGYTISSKGYSDCFFAELDKHSSETANADEPPSAVTPLNIVPDPETAAGEKGPATYIAMQRLSGTYIVPVSINGRLSLDFVVDSGAADVSIPADVVLTLMRTGTIQGNDFVGTQRYRLADGSVVPSMTFRIRTLEVGGHEVRNVLGSVAPVSGTLLLGQSFLGRFKSWSIDNHRHVLVLN
jgi:hypothetical protein